jgi:mono/diheme cytochrome c family protein
MITGPTVERVIHDYWTIHHRTVSGRCNAPGSGDFEHDAAALRLGVLRRPSARRVRHAQAWEAPAGEKGKKNPLPDDKATREMGEKVAKTNCVSCHGAKGKGDGAAAAALNPKPADWTSKKVQAESDGEIFWKISTGRGAMPSWKFLPENDRWALVRYIRSLGGK